VALPAPQNAFSSGPFDEAADVRYDDISLVRIFNDSVLHVHDEECGVGPALECAHEFPLLPRFAPGRPIYEMDVRDGAPVVISRGCKQATGKVLVQMLHHVGTRWERVMDIERGYFCASVRDRYVDIVYPDRPGIAKGGIV
jgi:hypothetical protein